MLSVVLHKPFFESEVLQMKLSQEVIHGYYIGSILFLPEREGVKSLGGFLQD